jgi:hypothetical protein
MDRPLPASRLYRIHFPSAFQLLVLSLPFFLSFFLPFLLPLSPVFCGRLFPQMRSCNAGTPGKRKVEQVFDCWILPPIGMLCCADGSRWNLFGPTNVAAGGRFRRPLRKGKAGRESAVVLLSCTVERV